jgi:hypothetical protein
MQLWLAWRRLWVSPRFHRLHHSIGIGHESAGRQTLGGHNFGVLFPWWDMMFGTVDFSNRYDPTGVRDQVEYGRDYGQSFCGATKTGRHQTIYKISPSMKKVIDSFWRSVAYCFHPKVILLSLLPLILMLVIVLGLGSLYWELAVNQFGFGWTPPA